MKLGLLGGMGVESTLIYYKEINRLYLEKINRNEFPNFTIESLDVWKLLELESDEKYKQELIDLFLSHIQHLKNANCTIAAFTAITPHMVFDEVAKASPIPLVSIITTGASYAKEKGYQKLALLGTYYTMNGTFIQKEFAKYNIEVIIPTQNEMKYIHQKLITEIEFGIIKEDTVEGMEQIANRLIEEEQVDGIILGCTELPLVFDSVNLKVEKLDLMKIHIDALVDLLIANQ